MNNGDKLIKKPIYIGGRKAMSQFIHEQLSYPDKAREKKTEGVVSVRIDIDEHGKVKKAVTKKKLGDGCDEEAMRVCSLLTFVVDHKRKKRMTFHKTINVHFKLPKEKLKPVKTDQGPKKIITPPPPKTQSTPDTNTSSTASSTMGGNYTVTYTFVTKPRKNDADKSNK